MRSMDEKLLELRRRGESEMSTYAERFEEIHGKALDFFDKALSEDIEFTEENAKLLNIQLAAASKTIQTSAKLAIERFRGQNMGALARLLERMQTPALEHEVAEPELVGFDT